MKALLIQAKQKKHDRFLVHPPYGLLYLASVLRMNNWDVKIYDTNIEFLKNNDDYNNGISHIIDSWNPDIVGIGGMVSSFKFAQDLSEYLKDKYVSLPLVAGGLLISAAPELVMNNSKFDIGCIGEAEEIIVSLFDRIIRKDRLDDIPGLVLRQNDGMVYITPGKFSNGRRERTKTDLDWIPFPSYDLIDLRKYFDYQSFCADLLKNYLRKQGKTAKNLTGITPFAMPIFSGRGCPFSCTFCFSTMNKKPVKHSVDYVIKHLEYLQTHYGINHFQFLDENFNLNHDWVNEFCDKMIKSGKNYYFTTGNRNRVGFFDRGMLELMKRANFYDVSIGVESFDDDILNEMNRGTNPEKILETLRLIKDVGIEQEHLRCLFGFPSDTDKTIFNSITKGNSAGYKTLFALVMPLPGTKLYDYCVKKQIIKDEVSYLRELYDGDGYRNLTSYKSLKDVCQAIYKANFYSEINYYSKQKKYLTCIKLTIIFLLRVNKRYLEWLINSVRAYKAMKTRKSYSGLKNCSLN
jgi:anaerobic magnesium-protoporphyrin IX monomethyl ester cyclase